MHFGAKVRVVKEGEPDRLGFVTGDPDEAGHAWVTVLPGPNKNGEDFSGEINTVQAGPDTPYKLEPIQAR